MLEMTSEGLSLSIAEAGSSVSIADRRRGCAWRVDLSRAGYRLRGDDGALRPLPAGTAQRVDGGIEVHYPAAGGAFVHRYLPADDHVEVILECDAEQVEAVSLPGPVLPTEGPCQVAAPLYQGVLLSGSAVMM